MFYQHFFTCNYHGTPGIKEGAFSKQLQELLTNVLRTSNAHFAAGPGESPENVAWVITQYDIHLNIALDLLQDYSISTRVVDVNRFFVTRQFLVRVDLDLVAEVFIQFATIDYVSRKLLRVELADLDKFEGRPVEFPKYPLDQDGQQHLEEKVVIIDQDAIDENNHVNNLVYLTWALDLLADSVDIEGSVRRISVKYGAEVFLSQEVKIRLFHLFKHQYFVKMINLTTGKEACKLLIEMEQDI